MSWKLWGGAVVALAWVGSASASCWVEAGKRHSIEPELLYAIAQVESRLDSRAVNHNTDGSRDIGLMQINSAHLPRLQVRGITEQRLLDEPCLAIEVGASILAQFIDRYGYNWTAVGAYNAGNSPDRQALRLRYARKVWQRYQALLTGDAGNHQTFANPRPSI
ncbi:transglycosylase SLT domain-containing protein [Pseudomonas chlororaphis]|uniref:Cell invasion protein n=1 Tax=Pseudomonas chlororaphis TaxID=587753 RepID=A0AAX3FRA2_9PSED|nr:transglycosylase SLT domain-containing protein [Pseudomonas chlororaphis]AZC44737.1 Invasion protein IagB precursor [Pseudomonas chlororaphis subsp. piscium]WDG70345.1 transglycosylase SLT domain-containing protein [Pseudomonas chlororaphis]WDH31869.1 transglycosylase SLT domain-containing protein [Pseudomonas chlororaphis]WDH68871.1 transglycosylase SLT domain-containing protein [Pseudomonas chlororaphis]VEF72686.1 cell invasion protein [Pseudomonas chlororaphis]